MDNKAPSKFQSDIPCRQTFASGVDLLLKLARQQAEKSQISVATLDYLAQTIQNDPAIREKYCVAQFEKCASHMRNSLKHAPRVNVYGRIIAEPFEQLFKTNPPTMASAQLNNLFHAVELILGRAEYENLMERSLKVMERLTKKHGKKFTYEHLYQDDECWDIRWDSIMALSIFFSNFHIRKDWFKRIMQSSPETPGIGVGPYPFSDFQFKAMMMCIFRAVTNMSDQERERFEARYKRHQRRVLSDFLAEISSLDDEA